MKSILLIISIGLGVFLGIFPGFKTSKGLWLKLLIFLVLSVAIVMTLIPPLATTPQVASFLALRNYEKPINVELSQSQISQLSKDSRIDFGDKHSFVFSVPDNLPKQGNLILKIKYRPEKAEFTYLEIVSVDPIIQYSFIAGLEDKIRILNFHVPMSWISVLAFLVSMVYSVMYLRKKNYEHDIIASSSASLGLLFTILATLTGMLWAKFNWGSFWNWDPRESSILILMLIYSAYFALRASIPNYESKARLSAVYSIIAFVTVPFLIFILPRLTSGLHPGSASDSNAGPVLSQDAGMLDANLLISFSLAMFGFTLLFFWMLNIIIRYNNLNIKLANTKGI